MLTEADTGVAGGVAVEPPPEPLAPPLVEPPDANTTCSPENAICEAETPSSVAASHQPLAAPPVPAGASHIWASPAASEVILA